MTILCTQNMGNYLKKISPPNELIPGKIRQGPQMVITQNMREVV